MDKLNRRNFIKGTTIAGAGLLLGGKGWTQAAGADSVARYFTREQGKLKLLAVTDLHFFDSKTPEDNNQKSVAELKALVEKFKPELMLLNGDTWFEDLGGKSFQHCQWATEQIGGLGIPWIFNFGNHDATQDFNKVYETLTNAPNSLFRGSANYGDYRVEICNPGGLNPFWNLIIVNDYFPDRGFNRYQINWFNAEVARIREKYPTPAPSFIFAHIPLPQFNDLWKKGNAVGIKGEPVMFEGGTKKAFDAIKNSGMVRACFAGHDHLNNYWGNLDGIRLQYLRATGYGGYGGEKLKKGGTIIEIDLSRPEPKFETTTVFEDGSTWTPEAKGK